MLLSKWPNHLFTIMHQNREGERIKRTLKGEEYFIKPFCCCRTMPESKHHKWQWLKAERFDFSLLSNLTPSDFYLKVDPSCVVELYDINHGVSLQSFDGFSASKLAETMLENKV